MSGSTPSTATVLEFRCLFTHDLRRKQKRWQDGRLKYHSFNARVMVYDERGNSVGDMHWHGEYDFGEGEEVQLDRGGVIVQVEELVERRETDLTELVDKRLQEKQQRQIQQLARSAVSGAVLPRSLHRPPAIAPDRVHPPRHRPLHHVIGTPTGHHGKALVPNESPYEQRQQPAESPDDRAAKRRRYDDPPPSKSGYASALFGQTLTLSATPLSSVPAIRRPRPEAVSDPIAETDSRDDREGPRPPRREQPQSSRRLNQTGYAQSLFGPTLTLSHTPVSSVPSRPQPQKEPASSPMVDNDGQDLLETARLKPPQQPIESRRLGNPDSKPRSALPRAPTSMGNGLQEDEPDVGLSKAHANMSRRNHATNSVHPIPEGIDIIEIDDPEPFAAPPIRKPRVQKTTLASLRNPEEDAHNSKVTLGQKPVFHEDLARPRKQQRLEHGRGSKPRKAKGHEETRTSETAVSEAGMRNTNSAHMDPTNHENVPRVPAVTRDPTLPVIELRIKSSKKRGLLMISDTSKGKKTRRQVTADSAGSIKSGSRHQSRDSDDDDPFQSPSSRLASDFGNGRDAAKSAKNPTVVSSHLLSNGNDLDYPVLNRDGRWENEEAVIELGKKSVQRTISTELGEDDDPFRSFTPAIPGRRHAMPKPAAGDSDMQLGHAKPARVETTAQTTSNVGLFAGNNGGREPANAAPTKRHPSSPTRAGYDPYQIPSSPEVSSPGSSSSAQRKRDANEVDEILRPIDNNEKLSKAKKQRHGRRKVVSDEDEDNIEPLASLPKRSDSGSDPEQIAPSRLAREASKRQPKSGKATSKKTSAQEDFSTVESENERPKRAARKSRGQQKGLDMGSDEDELRIKRRSSTRQRRSRAASYEDPSPLPSEQDGSEEEEIPRKRRKTKTSKASEHRPRLEKIKKNVKSRELVGFNLAALNAPLGLRGIGMPFSILPSPVNESIQSRVSTHAAADENLSPKVIHRGDDQIIPPNPVPPAAPSKMNAEAQQESPAATSKNETPNRVEPAPSRPRVYERGISGENLLGGLDRVDEPGSPRLSGNHAAKKSDAPAALSPQQPAASKPRLEAPQHHAAVTTLLDNVTGVSSKHSLSSLNQPVQDKSSTLRRQSSAGANKNTSEDTTLEVPTKTVMTAQPSLAPAPARTAKPTIQTGPSLQGRSCANDRQQSTTVQTTGGETNAPTQELIPAEHNTADTSAHKSNSVEIDPSVPTGDDMAPSAVKELDSVSTRHSLTTGNQNSVTVEKILEDPGSDTASDLPVRQSKAIGLRRQVSAPRRINNIAAKITSQAATTGALSTDGHTKPLSNARLANPASRGRKAALASDAAGQVPQRILPPTQPALMVPISTADLAMTPIEQTPKEPERPKKKMTFPGFQTARSEGPWSREAFDLLESGRPE